MDYQQSEGKYGPIYHIAEGLRVGLNEWGSWEVIVKREGDRKKKAIGKGEENFKKAIRAAEMLALKLGIPLARETGNRTFGMVIEDWYNLNAQRWQPGTKERYQLS